jgi:hypothetical protein
MSTAACPTSAGGAAQAMVLINKVRVKMAVKKARPLVLPEKDEQRIFYLQVFRLSLLLLAAPEKIPPPAGKKCPPETRSPGHPGLVTL